MEGAAAEKLATPDTASGRFRTEIPVRWSDCDPAGILYYPNYYSYQETAMVEFFRGRGLSWRTLQDRYGVHFPRVESHCRYTASVNYEDIVEVEIHVPEVTRKIITMAFTMFRKRDGAQLCEGYVKFAMAPFVGPNGTPPRAMELPDELRSIFDHLQ